MSLRDAVFRSLAGSVAGDALGLPYENLSARRGARLLGEPTRYRLALGRGMVSDDAEHACMTAAAFAGCGGDVERFRRDLARRLRWWLLTILCGIGLATLKSTLRLWLGWPPSRSGVRSAGNGPAMRAAVLGRCCDADRLFDFISASTAITHRDARATLGAYLVAVASRAFADASSAAEPLDGTRSIPPSFEEVRVALRNRADASEAIALLDRVADSLARSEPTERFADAICRRRGRVSGYVYETVPVALHAAFAHPDTLDAIRAAIRCGGDTDSVASIVGGIRGLDDASPLLDRLMEWPCNSTWLRRLADSAADGTRPPKLPFVSRLARNGLQFAIVLAHVIRRALPPY